MHHLIICIFHIFAYRLKIHDSLSDFKKCFSNKEKSGELSLGVQDTYWFGFIQEFNCYFDELFLIPLHVNSFCM